MTRSCIPVRFLAPVFAATLVAATWIGLLPRRVFVAAAQAPAALPSPALHHVGLNVVDPARSQQFYKTMWPQGEITTFAGLPAYKAEMYLLFTKVGKPAPGAWDPKEHRSLQQSPLWHIGFETQTPTSVLRERIKAATAAYVPLFSSATDTGSLWRAGEMGYGRNPIVTAQMMKEKPAGKPEEGGYSYFLGPDGELVEAGGGPGQVDSFEHIHFLHEQPWCAAQWYIEHLGFRQRGRGRSRSRAPGRLAPRAGRRWSSRARLRDPRVTVGLTGTSFSWYVRPCQPGRCREGAVKLMPSRGLVLDHIGLTYPDLDIHVPRLRKEGVRIVEEIHPWGGTRAAMIEDLDGMAIMLVERQDAK